MARVAVDALRDKFPGRLILKFGDIEEPSGSPNLTVPDFSVGLLEDE